MFPYVQILYFMYLYLKESIGEPYFKSVRNADFDGKKLAETYIRRINGISLIRCTGYCAAAPKCLSLNYHEPSGTCVLFDMDFIKASLNDALPENGWQYYYLGRDYKHNPPPRCVSTIPTGICSLFCLHYIYDAVASPADLVSMCSQADGGEVVKVDRELKQHCVESLLGDKKDGEVIIQGSKDPLTGIWKYDDGTNITFFNWDTTNDQPDATVFTDEPRITLRRTTDYKWHDASGTMQDAVVCQQS